MVWYTSYYTQDFLTPHQFFLINLFFSYMKTTMSFSLSDYNSYPKVNQCKLALQCLHPPRSILFIGLCSLHFQVSTRVIWRDSSILIIASLYERVICKTESNLTKTLAILQKLSNVYFLCGMEKAFLIDYLFYFYFIFW